MESDELGMPPLGSRYRLLKQLGQGGFGQTYLAEDLNRFKELCVLKAFVPQVSDPSLLVKANELFEREAGVLYQLQHPQVPRFRELLRVEPDGDGGRLFLVQDYVEGPTYRTLLTNRLRHGGHFTELEVTQLLHQLLPVLSYLHDLGVIHRDISPENLILRNTDGLPVVIDFGSVKQVAAHVREQLAADEPQDRTRIGRVGYMPPEQLQTGTVDPTSDLYGLGVTALVLATGQEADALYDPASRQWDWSSVAEFSQPLQSVLERLLAAAPADRFPSAAAALAALGADTKAALPSGEGAIAPSTSASPGTGPDTNGILSDETAPIPTSAATVAVVPPVDDALAEATALPPPELVATEPYPTTEAPVPGCWQAAVGLLVLLGLAGLLGLLLVGRPGLFRFPNRPTAPEVDTPTDGTSGLPATGPYSAEETARKQALQDRRQDLAVPEAYLSRLTNQIFYQRYPDLRDRALTDRPEDAPLRLRWDNLASDLLDILAANLSTQARRGLGSYGPTNRDQWQSQVNALNVSSRALYDLSDAKFSRLFPTQSSEAALSQPVGQIWYALADDRVRALTSGDRLRTIQFEPNAFSQQVSGQLAPGEGQVFLLNLTADQILRLTLQAPENTVLLSLYVPTPTEDLPFLLSDATETRWTGRLPQTGYYEVVVVSKADSTLSYQLTTIVDRVTTPPADEADGEETGPDAPGDENGASDSPADESANGTDTESPADEEDTPADAPESTGIQF